MDGELDRFVKARYATFESGIGKTVTTGKATFESLEKHALKLGSVIPASGRQEMLENLINDYMDRGTGPIPEPAATGSLMTL